MQFVFVDKHENRLKKHDYLHTQFLTWKWKLILPPFSCPPLLPACPHVLPFLVIVFFLLLSSPHCSTGGGRARHEEVPAENRRASLRH